jgi:hypothetical protein
MRLSLLSCVACAILFGLVWQTPSFAVGGAVIHLLAGFADLFLLYRTAKLIRAGTVDPAAQTGLADRIAGWIDGAITLTGLVLVVVTQKSETSGYAVAGWLIWGGAIACYFLSGIILREVGGVPLSMGYGGWAIRRIRNGRYRR